MQGMKPLETDLVLAFFGSSTHRAARLGIVPSKIRSTRSSASIPPPLCWRDPEPAEPAEPPELLEDVVDEVEPTGIQQRIVQGTALHESEWSSHKSIIIVSFDDLGCDLQTVVSGELGDRTAHRRQTSGEHPMKHLQVIV